MDKIDLELTQSLGQAVSTMFSVLGAVGAIVAATKGTLLVALLPIGYGMSLCRTAMSEMKTHPNNSKPTTSYKSGSARAPLSSRGLLP